MSPCAAVRRRTLVFRIAVVFLAASLGWILQCGTDLVDTGPGLDTPDGARDGGPDIAWVDGRGAVDAPDGRVGDARADARDVKVPPDVVVDCEADPGAFLCPCRENTDCDSGYCVPIGDGSQTVCTRECREECPDGWLCKGVAGTWPDVVFICVPEVDRLCLPCTVALECAAAGDLCLPIGVGEGAGTFCTTDCSLTGECHEGYTCGDVTGDGGGVIGRQCLPDSGSCICTPDVLGTTRPCEVSNGLGTCYGEEQCEGPRGWVGCTAATPAEEVCNRRDEDCDGEFDEDFVIVDWDGVERAVGEACGTGLCAGGLVTCAGEAGAECSSAPQAAAEACNAIDDDCDGQTDEGLLRVFYRDGDQDGHGYALDTVQACLEPEGYVVDGDDCDDTDGLIAPGLPELCDGENNDCDDETDEDFGWGLAGAETLTPIGGGCGAGLCAGGVVECADVHAATCSTLGLAEPEACDEVDQDCDGVADDGCDDDVDGWCDADLEFAEGAAPEVCPEGAGDCDDADEEVHPEADERCNGGDDDCDGTTDEDVVDCPSFSCTGRLDDYFETGVASCEDGGCFSPEAVGCGLYTCSGGGATGDTCAADCGDDTTCIASAHCDEATETCVPDAGAGAPCLEESDCAAGLYCRNGFCCGAANGDCCAQPADCPASYAQAAACDTPATCQGTRRDAVCEGAVCGTGPAVDDDTACGAATLALDCAPYPPVHCTGAASQTAPGCAAECLRDTDCRDGYHCDGECRADVPDGGECDEASDCVSGHCRNGFCCAVGDCCAHPEDCPAAWFKAPTCDDALTCQGTRIDAVCEGWTCASTEPVADDSGCGADTVANPCGFYLSLHCTGDANQLPPECPVTCGADDECDPVAHCDGVCEPDRIDGAVCDEDSDCATGHCGNGLCCAEGDCCNSAVDCVGLGYGGTPVCDFPSACQGTVDAPACRSNMCGSAPGTADDSGCTAETLAKTCGLYPPVFCDGTVEQTEPACPLTCLEDKDCVDEAHCEDGLCVADLPDGLPCDEPSDCAAGHCQNGFCCAGGDCCAQPADCPAGWAVAAACDDAATCQGTRRDAVCVAARCGTSEPLPDDSGCTRETMAQDCTPYQPVWCTGAAQQVAPECGAACAADGECQPGYHCDGTCQPDVGDGFSCDEDSDCTGEHCQNGFCCASGDCCSVAADCPAAYRTAPACDDPATCQGHRVDATCTASVCGRTADIPDDGGCGADVEAHPCGLYVAVRCTGAATQTAPVCPQSCVGDPACDPAAHCDTVCTEDLPDGQGCDENSDCLTGHCQNGFCCTGGDCCGVAAHCPDGYRRAPSCDVTAACQGTADVATCVASTCGTQTNVPNDSACTATVQAKDCGLYPAVFCSGAADQSEPGCPAACLADGDCDPPAHCDDGACQADLGPGLPCDEASDCVSGHCQNGFCCASGDCCARATDCDPGVYGAPSVCEDAHTCQGRRRDPVCSGAQCQLGPPVDDDSGCAGTVADACGLYPAVTCSAAPSQTAPTCPASCVDDAGCDPAAHCAVGVCRADLLDGSVCGADRECASGHCQNGYCCANGDCCSAAANCPATYRVAPVCDDAAGCQGHRVDATCTGSVCGSTGDLADDTGCGPTTEAAGCNLYRPVFCSGAANQVAPSCPTTCATNAECDPGAHCDGACLANVANGGACDEGSDCVSGHCQNGFCCSGGDCCAVAGDCPASYSTAPVCDFPSTCQGTADRAQCTGFVCSTLADVPDDSACTPAVVAKDCGLYPSVRCAGGASQTEPPCVTLCGTDAGCDDAAHCDGGQCLADLANGSACDEASDCTSGHCQNGYCCGGGDCCAVAANCPASYTQAATCTDPTRCQGTRRDPTCTASVCGTTAPIEDDTGCGPGVQAKDCTPFLPVFCTGQPSQVEPQCAASCTVDGQCQAGYHCDGTCQPDRANGLSCDENSDCLSDHCQNGYCCGSGDCCSVAGDCPAIYRTAPVCDTVATCQGHRVDATCTTNVCGSSASLPDDSGCAAGTVANECGPYLPARCAGGVDQTQPACPGACSADVECDAEAHCDGTCQADLPNGSPCDEGSDCSAGHCQNGFCCATGDCCATAANCTAPEYRLVPTCDNAATCQGRRRDPVCQTNQCAIGAYVDDDSGCGGLEASDCALYPSIYCTTAQSQPAPTCPASCATDAQCDANAHCDGALCFADLPAGQGCDEASDCLSGLFCVDGVCCTTQCTGGLCRRCDVAGFAGTCTYVPTGQDPDLECGGVSCNGWYHGWLGDVCYDRADVPAATAACNGAGACQGALDLCPLQGRGDATTTCHPLCQDPTGGTCTGNTAGTCTNVNPGAQTCGVGECYRSVPLCVNGAPNTCVPGSPAPEVCNTRDDDCDSLTDAADPSDLVANDPRDCANQNGVCDGCTKPANLCVGGLWQACSSAHYDACSPYYEPGFEVSCDGRDNDCDGAVDDDFLSDPNNCGACGRVCTNPHGTTSCVNGTCTPVCDVGYKSCDGNVVNGCERSIRTLTDCGDCNVACDLPNGGETCTSGTCTLTSCDLGWGDCNAGAGCETDLDLDPTCASSFNMGSVCGDVSSGFLCLDDPCVTGPAQSGYGEKFFKVYVDECSDCLTDLRLRVRLQSPANADYDLYLYEPCGTQRAASTYGTGQLDEVTFSWGDNWGSDDARWVYIQVRYYSGSTCAQWTLQTKGGCAGGW